MKRSILYLQYTSPANYPPLEHSGLILLKAGWQAHFFGIQSQGGSCKLAFPEPLAGHVTLLKHQPPGLKQKLHFISFTLASLWLAIWQRPAWVYCSDLMSCPAAWLIGRFTRCRVLYHEHDSPNEESRKQKVESRNPSRKAETLKTEIRKSEGGPVKWQTEDFTGQGKRPSEVATQRLHEPGKVEIGKAETLKSEMLKEQSNERTTDDGRRTTDDRPPASDFRPPTSGFQLFLLWSRKCVGRKAELVVLPNEKRLEIFAQTTGRQKTSLCVFNCPRKDEVMPQKGESVAQGVLRLAFHGSINCDRLPMAVLEAMSRFPGRVHLSVVGYETVGIKGYMTEFLQTAESLGLGNAVEFVGALPRHEIFEPASKCDVGLAFVPLQGGDMNMANMTGASNKPFDYLACGLALLVSARPDWEEMFVEPGYGLTCNPDDPGSIILALQWFIEHPEETRRMGERGRERILKEWNYETQFASVRTIINGKPHQPVNSLKRALPWNKKTFLS
jgi:glycosyltransferase involved in cell wall biosynthesis